MKIGDKVNVAMTTNDVFSLNIQKYSPIIRNCTIKYMPSFNGDTWYFITEDGIEFVVNPNCSSFAGIEKITEDIEIDEKDEKDCANAIITKFNLKCSAEEFLDELIKNIKKIESKAEKDFKGE